MSATLGSIAFNLASCSCVTVLSLVWFGLAVRARRFNDLLAPRTTARPSMVLQNVFLGRTKLSSSSNPNDSSSNSGDEQEGNNRNGCPSFTCYGLAWIPWAFALSYKEMIEGVPGTGTRAGGKSGTFLRTNIDGIILIRFQQLCLRVCCFATILLCGILLPLFRLAGCDADFREQDDPRCDHVASLTDFGKTTISHIPNMGSGGDFSSLSREPITLLQLMTVVVVAWILCAYTCAQLWKEWISNLALRRVYYLEQNHFKKRKIELKRQVNQHFEEEPFQRLRPPWIPHPELRETIPCISVQSILCELPEKPLDFKTGSTPKEQDQPDPSSTAPSYYGTGFATKSDWQLSKATKFFDSCIPNQPGFSSSVAAVTILPEAGLLAIAWKKWIVAGRLVRRSRYIRQLITEHLKFLRDNDELDEDDPEIIRAKSSALTVDEDRPGLVDFKLSDYGPCAKEFAVPDSVGFDDGRSHAEEQHLDGRTQGNKPEKLAYKNFDKSKLGYSQLFGSTTPTSRFHNEESESNFEEFLEDFGIEQTAAYSRAFAESAGGCCPRGCCTGKLRRANLTQLLSELKDTEEASAKAYEILLEARNDVSRYAKGHRVQRSAFGFDFDGDENDDDAPESDSEDEFDAEASDLLGRSIFFDSQYHSSSSRQWERARQIVQESKIMRSGSNRGPAGYKRTHMHRLLHHVSQSAKQMTCYFGKAVLNSSRRPTYAAVTFTSRQAAAAARQCLMDGSGTRQWEQQKEIPVPPLADSPAGTILTTYGWCLPVSVAISDGERILRRLIAMTFLILIYFFYTIPLSYAALVFTPDNLPEGFNISLNSSTRSGVVNNRSNGFIAGGIYSLFFFTLPYLFSAVANFGSGAISVRQAEYIATGYYWWFILLTAFTGSSLASSVVSGFESGFNISSEFESLIVTVAAVIPTQISATWISWIVIKATITFPLSYLCFVFTFLLDCCGMKYFSRVLRGRSSGPAVPFRIFVDAGTVMLCVLALAPAAPLVAPIGLLYFLISTPILKYGLIFVYRPVFDDGGRRWPQLFSMVVSAIVLSQILLTAILALKEAALPSLLSGLGILGTVFFSLTARRQFSRAYMDAGLLQTSRLDGWDTSRTTSAKAREEYRKWLVDCHKASYIPACLVGSDNILTAEPSITIPLDYDQEEGNEEIPIRFQRPRSRTLSSIPSPNSEDSDDTTPTWPFPNGAPTGQRGVLIRRVSRGLRGSVMQQRGKAASLLSGGPMSDRSKNSIMELDPIIDP